MKTNIQSKQRTIIAAIILSLLCIISGCDKKTAAKVNANTPKAEYSAETMSFFVPYNDLKNDNGELGWYRPIGDDDFSMELTKKGECNDKEVIDRILNLTNTDHFKAGGHIEGLDEIENAVNKYPPIQLKFDNNYYVMIYSNNVIVTNTFYTSGDIYDELAEKYYQENGSYPNAVTDGYYQFTSSSGTYEAVSEILLAL